MDKRALSAIPRPVVTEQNKEMLLLVPHMSYLVTAQREFINGKDTLIMNFFHAEKKKLKPEFRTFCQSDDYITQDLTTEKTKWKTGAINYLTGYLYWHKDNGNIVMASVEDRKTIMKFLLEFKKKHNVKDYVRYGNGDSSVTDTEVEDRIDEYQNQIKEWRLQKKHQKEKDEIDHQMMKFGDLPDDYESFVRKTVFSGKNYIFYSTKKSRAYCTCCGNEFELTKEKHLRHKTIPVWNDRDEVRHNHTVVCPYCMKIFKCKSEGMSRLSLFEVQWSVLVQKYEEEVLVRYFCHTKDFRTDYRNPKICTFEKYRTVHTENKVKDFEWTWFKSSNEIRWCNFRERYGWNTPPETEVPRSAVLYNTNLLEAVSGTCMKYSAVDIYVNKILEHERYFDKPWCIDWYFNSYRKNPYLEQLLKVGFYKLAESVLKDSKTPALKHGRTIMETLGITKNHFNMLRKVGNPSFRDVDILKYGQNLSEKEFDILRLIYDQSYWRRYEKYIDMRQYTTIYKLDKYLDKVGKSQQQNDYFDYIQWMTEMGYDMRNEFNLYPKDFQKAHDEKSAEYIKFKDKRAKEEIKKFNKWLKELRKGSADTEAMNLKVSGMFIRLPNQLDEIKKEGETLHHCVGTYVDRVAKGETMIFFIRKIEEPDKPFYTLEWKENKVAQCRGFKNCDMTPEVKLFSKLFEEKMIKSINKTNKERKLRNAS